MSLLQRLVSKKKRRFESHGFDLDMSYITDNVIAMGFPSEKMEALYRYRVYNLCSERDYDPSKFHDRVGCYPFDDHNAPPFQLIQEFCDDVRDWLAADDENIAVIHCKAGKGRTGEMICCWLMYTQEWSSPEDSMAFYACMRTYNMKGVTIPSQIRYIYYYYRSLQSGGTPPVADFRRVLLKSVTFHECPRIKDGIFFQIFRMGDLKTPLYTYRGSKGSPDAIKGLMAKAKSDAASGADLPPPGAQAPDCLIFDDLGNTPVELQGDVMVQWYEGSADGKSEKLCYVWLNTHYMDDDSLLLKHEIDKAHKDKENKVFPPNFSITVSVRDATAGAGDDAASSGGKKSRSKKKKGVDAAAVSGSVRPQDIDRGLLSRPGTLAADTEPVVLNDSQTVTVEAFAEARPAVADAGAVSISAYLVDKMAEAMSAHAVDGLVTGDQMEEVDEAEAVRVNRRECAVLRSVSLASLDTEPQRVAFWLNVYNTLSMHANAVYRPTTLKERLHMQVHYKFLVDGKPYSMAEILLFALRAPLPQSTQLERLLRERMKGSKPDRRLPAALTERELLITFAVNAGVPDAGEIVPYRVDKLEDTLEDTAQRYLRRLRINVSEHVVWVPRMLNWVKNDFGRTRAERFAILGDLMDKSDRKAWYACGDNPNGLHWSYNDQSLGFNFEHRVARAKRRLINRTGLGGLRTGSARHKGGRSMQRDHLERARSFESHSNTLAPPVPESSKKGRSSGGGKTPRSASKQHHHHHGHHHHGHHRSPAKGDGPPALPSSNDAVVSSEDRSAQSPAKQRKRRSSKSVGAKSHPGDASAALSANDDGGDSQQASEGSESDNDGSPSPSASGENANPDDATDSKKKKGGSSKKKKSSDKHKKK